MTTASSTPSIKLIVGLGNPGPEYTATRHNAGFWFAEQISEHYRLQLKHESKFKSMFAVRDDVQQPFRVLLPLLYMNRSGEPVRACSQFYKIKPEEILVAHDELDLEPGTARLKFDGGHGGHNGLRDIIAALGTNKFYRLRLGIGHPKVRDLVHDYVLHKPSKDDHQKIMDAISASQAVFEDILQGKFSKAMNQLHT